MKDDFSIPPEVTRTLGFLKVRYERVNKTGYIEMKRNTTLLQKHCHYKKFDKTKKL